jgi:hypothetical protein
MSNASLPSLSLFPVEILHRIFDGLDASTIVLSLRYTCRRLKAVVDTYDRYAVDFRGCSKSDFQRLCRLIDPRKVVSLVLSPTDETVDQMELFISSFRARQFSRIRSLTLNEIGERHLRDILKRFCIPSLVSFSITIGKYDERCLSTKALLSSIISQANLRHLDLELLYYQMRRRKMIWPAQCMIRYLKIGSYEDFDQIFTILGCSPYLQTLIVNFSNHLLNDIVLSNSLPKSFQQLTSLTLEHLHLRTNNIELFLSLMTSLTHFKLIGSGQYMNGNRWEQFIQANLPFLNKFELFVEERKTLDFTFSDVQSTIASFQTPFYLEHKKWFFTCEYNIDSPRLIKLYSIPVCKSSLTYEPESKKISLSSSNPLNNNDMSIMDNVNTFHLTFSNRWLDDIPQIIEVSFDIMFLLFLKILLR